MDADRKQLRKKENDLVSQNGFKDNSFKSCPKWVKVWVKLVLEQIEYENEQLLMVSSENKQDVVNEIQELKIQRMENLMNVLNKI